MQSLELASKKVQSAIEKRSSEIVGFLSEYIKRKSVNPKYEEGAEEKTCQDWLRDELESWRIYDKVDHWEKREGRPNVAAVLKGVGGGRNLMFNGHSDVVPVPKESLPYWTTDPFGGEVREGRVYGRGATDMKGGIAAFIWATRIVKESGIVLQGDVVDTMSIAEESGEHEIGVDTIIDRGYKADFLVNAESTNLQICPVGVGLYFFKLKVRGKPIHTSMKYKCSFPQPIGVQVPGVSAIDKMVKFITEFQELEREWAHRKKFELVPLGASNLTPTIIRGGEYIGGISENCEVIYNVWINPDERPEDSINEIRAFVKRMAENDEWMKEHPPVIEAPAPEFPVLWPSYSVPLDHPGATTLAQAYSSALKRDVKWGAFTAVADVVWTAEKGIPGLILGPGELTMGVHGIDEYVPIEHIVDCAKVYAEMILRWCGISKVQA